MAGACTEPRRATLAQLHLASRFDLLGLGNNRAFPRIDDGNLTVAGADREKGSGCEDDFERLLNLDNDIPNHFDGNRPKKIGAS